jgi:hypothetical protein
MKCWIRQQGPKRMRETSLACAAGSFLALMILTESLHAQFPPPTQPNAQPPAQQILPLGTQGFRAILSQYGLTPLKDFQDFEAADPKHTVIIAFRGAEANTKADLLDSVPDGLKSFVDRGGAVLVATDQPTRKSRWAKSFDVEVDGKIIYAKDGASRFYKTTVCPYIQEASPGAIPDLFRHPGSPPIIFNKKGRPERPVLKNVATNRPSFLSKLNELDNVAEIAPVCRYEGEDLVGPVHFAQAKYYSETHGKILVMADHSIFINEMLLPPQGDNDNLAFTLNTLDWLVAGPDGKRTKVLFIDQTGVIETDFSLLQQLPTPVPNIEDFPDFLQFLWDNRDKASEVVAAMEDSGLFQELEQNLDEFFVEHLGLWNIVRALLVFGMIAVFAISCRRVLVSRYRFAKAAPRLSLALDRFRPRGSFLDQRLRGSLRGGQCYEAARIRARQMFAEADWTPALEGGPSPKVQINTGWWQRRGLERDLRELWKIAFGAEPVAVPAKHWDKWLSRLNEIHKLIRDSVIRVS